MSAVPETHTAVVDANGIIGLAKGECFAFLPRIFNVVLVPPAVVREITDAVSGPQLQAALADWLEERAPTPHALAQVPQFGTDADLQALALALDRRPCVILTGDRQLTSKARGLGVLCINPPRVVQALAEAQVISAAGPHLDRMVQLGFGIPQTLRREILDALGE